MQASLDRLLEQGFISFDGQIYQFLTDQEQDVQREIKKTAIPASEVVAKISTVVFEEVYSAKNFRYENFNFPFVRMVDRQIYGPTRGEITLQILTIAEPAEEKDEMTLRKNSAERAIVVLNGDDYFMLFEQARKIEKYLQTRADGQDAKLTREIILACQQQRGKYDSDARSDLLKAIENAQFYVNGESVEFGGQAESKLEQAMKRLVESVYRDLKLVGAPVEGPEEIGRLFRGDAKSLKKFAANADAADEIEKFLVMQDAQNRLVPVADVQDYFQRKPFGWRDIDVAALLAWMFHDQRITLKRRGEPVPREFAKPEDILRGRSETGSTAVAIRKLAPQEKIRKAQNVLRELFGDMDIPEDEDRLVEYAVGKFQKEQRDCAVLRAQYARRKYPGRAKVEEASRLTENILNASKDNIALIEILIKEEEALLSAKVALGRVEGFFKNQAHFFDRARNYASALQHDKGCLSVDPDASEALEEIERIVAIPDDGEFDYSQIPNLNNLMGRVRRVHDGMLDARREKLGALVKESLQKLDEMASGSAAARKIFEEAQRWFRQKESEAKSCQAITLLDGITTQARDYDARAREKIRFAPSDPEPPERGETPAAMPSAPRKPKVASFPRLEIFASKTFRTETEIDEYFEHIAEAMKNALKTCDEIELR